MSLKENFVQAAKELMNGPETAQETKVEPVDLGLDKKTGMASAVNQPEKLASLLEEESPEEYLKKTDGQRRTMIAEGTVIEGNLKTVNGLDLYGEMHGDITGSGNLKICGKIYGNMEGNNIEICTSQIKGDIKAGGKLEAGTGVSIVGNIQAENFVLNGKVKGNIQINQTLILEEKAIVAGNIAAGRLTVEEGAVIQGEMRIAASGIDKLFFQQEEKEAEKQAVQEKSDKDKMQERMQERMQEKMQEKLQERVQMISDVEE